ncbi:MAG: ABC transporter substrate-binding protein, partial [Clostridiales bacterium]|nr:ABC transporter substrate-binding protein [Clostridiales bacterium]
MMKRRLLALALCLALALGLCACGSSSQDEDSAVSSTTSEDVSADVSADTGDGELTAVTVQLKWVQQAQFMGYYAAKELGIYEAYGLDVTIVPGGSVDVVDEVDSGRAEFGVTWVSTLMSAVSNGANVMAVAQYYQDSGMTLVSL